MQKILIYFHLPIPLNSNNWVNDRNKPCLPLSTPIPNALQVHSYCWGRSWVWKAVKTGIGVKEDTGVPGGNRLKTASPKVISPVFPNKDPDFCQKILKGLRTIFRGNWELLEGYWAEGKRKQDFSPITRRKEGVFLELVGRLSSTLYSFLGSFVVLFFHFLINLVILYQNLMLLDSLSKLNSQISF